MTSLAQRSDWARSNLHSWCRVTAFASFQGELFACTGACAGRAVDVDPEGTLGRVYSVRAGQVASHEKDIGGGWTHLAAVRQGPQLRLFVNAQLAASTQAPEGRDFSHTPACWSGNRPALLPVLPPQHQRPGFAARGAVAALDAGVAQPLEVKQR